MLVLSLPNKPPKIAKYGKISQNESVLAHSSNDSPLAINTRPTWYSDTALDDVVSWNTNPMPRPDSKPRQPAIRISIDSADDFKPGGP